MPARRDSCALAMELRLFCIIPPIQCILHGLGFQTNLAVSRTLHTYDKDKGYLASR